jgi:hypothetical protein
MLHKCPVAQLNEAWSYISLVQKRPYQPRPWMPAVAGMTITRSCPRKQASSSRLSHGTLLCGASRSSMREL